MKTPILPFPGYKWRWAEVTPSEGLNHPFKLLGVLRVLSLHEGSAASSPEIRADLQILDEELSQIGLQSRLARETPDRNIMRNMGRYWTALGLVQPDYSNITLTNLGRRVASGKVTQQEFATAIIKSLTLPNRNIEGDVRVWENAGLKIKPLELILGIIVRLYESLGTENGYLTSEELCQIVIPLAGNKVTLEQHINAIIKYRQGQLDVSTWPGCGSGDNDQRMAREFLLFLGYYDICVVEGKGTRTQKFRLDVARYAHARQILNFNTADSANAAINIIRENPALLATERERRLTEVIARPRQAIFRQQVLTNYNSTCLLTKETFSSVLQAAHIIPVKDSGIDEPQNAFCFRADIHLLFDLGHIRIDRDGRVSTSEALSSSPSYKNLPSNVALPAFVDLSLVEIRFKYYG